MASKSIGQFWVEWLTSANAVELPLVFRGLGLEKRQPWRQGPCIVVRIPWTRFGVALGRWTGQAPVEDDFYGERLAFRPLTGQERDDALG